MPKCLYPDCPNFAIFKGHGFCGAHQTASKSDRNRLLKEISDKKQRDEAKKIADAAKLAADAERARQAAAAAEKERNKRSFIANKITHFDAQVTSVVVQVERLRNRDASANAGENDVGNTQGGTKCPVIFVMGNQTYGATPADISPHIAGFDSSDSGVFKYRRGTILVHCTFA